MSRKILPPSVWSLDTVALARRLLGMELIREIEGEELGGRIVETEAYLGANDPAAHSRRGLRSQRNESMYLPAGHVYVYFTYGMHYCMNVVSAEEGFAEAVLIRALEPTRGEAHMRERRPAAKRLHDLTNGPAKLCQALSIDRKLDGAMLNTNELHLYEGDSPLPDEAIGISGRIGIDNSGVSHWPLRFFEQESSWLSR